MTLPSGLLQHLAASYGAPQRFGVPLCFFPADPRLAIELHRADDAAGTNDGFVAVIPPGTLVFIDELPSGSASKWYRIRHVDPSGALDPSPFTSPRFQGLPRWLPADALSQGSPVAPVVTASFSESATAATVTITVIDPQIRVTSVQFDTKAGDGAWSGWVTDATEPYSASVNKVADRSSRIRWRVNGYDNTGRLVELSAGEREFFGGAAQCIARIQSATDATVVVIVEGKAPSGTPQIQLIEPLSPAANAPTASSGGAPALAGSLVASGTTFTFPKPIGTLDFTARFRAVVDAFAQDEDAIVIARDTTNLQVVVDVRSTTETKCVVRATVTDARPVAGNSITLTPTPEAGVTFRFLTAIGGASGGASGTPVLVPNGGWAEWEVNRPSYGAGSGRFTVTATASARVRDTDSADIPAQSIQTLAPSASDITLGTPIAYSNYVRVPFSFPGTVVTNPTRYVEVWAQEWSTMPADTSVEGLGFHPTGTPLQRDTASTYVDIPVAKPGNWLVVSFVCWDSLGRRGTERRVRVQSTAAGTLPAALAGVINFSKTTSSVTNRVTMPGSNLPTTINVYRDGIPYGSAITVTALAGATQDIVHSGLPADTTYLWEYRSVNAVGENPSGVSVSVKTDAVVAPLPAPTDFVAYWFGGMSPNSVSASWEPGVGTPSGVTYALEEDDGAGVWVTALGTTGTSPFQYDRADPGATRGIRIRATKAGHPSSAWVVATIIRV